MPTTRTPSPAYRADIDGLRAIAVGGVLLFHAFPALLPGGYVGVDVFFVISGFLITRIVRRQTLAGTFSVSEFYERRIRRIFPALAVVLGVTSLACLVILPPQDLKAYGRSLPPSVAFLANFHFWTRGSYFNPPQDVRPLLHLWSLGVEEQFYLVWPPLLWTAARWPAVRVRLVLLALVLASLVADEVFVHRDILAAFYSPLLRAWEPLLGALLALTPDPWRRRPMIGQGLGLIGLTAIVGSMALLTETTPFPGLAALPACLGAAAVLHAGRGEIKTLTSGFLSLAPLVWLGGISYSLYLWHWPILTFLRLGLAEEPPAYEMVFGLLLSVGLSALSARWVERRFRRRPVNGLSRRGLFAATAGGVAVLALSGSLLAADEGLQGRAHGLALETMAAEHDVGGLWRECHSKKTPAPGACLFGAGDSQKSGPQNLDLLVWGDSLAASWSPAIADWASVHHLKGRLATESGCLPSLGLDVHEHDGSVTPCRVHNLALLQSVRATPTLKTVILVARWPIYDTGNGPVEGPWYFITRPGGVDQPSAYHALLQSGLERLVSTLTRDGPPSLRIVVVGPSPEFPVNPDRCAQRAIFIHRDPSPCLNPPSGPIAARQAGSIAILRAVAARHPNVTLVFPDPLFCDAQFCHAVIGGHLGFIDGDHLTQTVARLVGPGLTVNWPVAATPDRAPLPEPRRAL